MYISVAHPFYEVSEEGALAAVGGVLSLLSAGAVIVLAVAGGQS